MGLRAFLSKFRGNKKSRPPGRRGRARSRAGARLNSVVSEGDTEYYSADDLTSSDSLPASPRRSHGGETNGHGLEHPLDSAEDGIVSDAANRAQPLHLVKDKLGESAPLLGHLHGPGSLSKRRSGSAGRPPIGGASFKRKPSELDAFEALECFEETDATNFNVRGVDYMRTKKKISSAPAILRLLDIDVFATDFKLYHIARHLELPAVPQISDEVCCSKISCGGVVSGSRMPCMWGFRT